MGDVDSQIHINSQRRKKMAKNEVQPMQQQLIQFPDVEFRETGLDINKKISIEQAMKLAEGLYKISKAHQFWWGDLLNYGEKLYGEEYAQLVPDPEEIDTSTLKKWKWVASRIKPKNRVKELTYSHHEAVAGEDKEERRKELLKQAKKDKLTVSALKKLIRPAKKSEIPIEKCPACGEEFERGAGKKKD